MIHLSKSPQDDVNPPFLHHSNNPLFLQSTIDFGSEYGFGREPEELSRINTEMLKDNFCEVFEQVFCVMMRERGKEGERGRQRDRETGRQTDRQTDRL